MIVVKVFRKKDFTWRIKAEGHAEIAEKGQDVVCAAVSAIVQSVVIGLQEVIKKDIKVSKEDGYISIEWTPNSESEILAQTMIHSIRNIEKQYPKNVKMEEH